MAALITEEDLRDLRQRIELMKKGRERVSGIELRWKFWAYAIQYVQRSNKDTGIFQDRSYAQEKQPENAIWDELDAEGVTIHCIVKSNSASVELHFDQNEGMSRALFDHLYDRRRYLTELVNMPLRFESYRSDRPGRICVVKSETDILNMEDWKEIARFLSESSYTLSKFLDMMFIVVSN